MPSILASSRPIGNSNRSSPITLNPVTLAFTGESAQLEKPFLDQYAENSLQQMRFALGLGIALYAMFGVLDYIIVPEWMVHFWLVRYAIVCPSLAVVISLSFMPWFKKIMQAALSLLILVGGGGIIYMTMVGPPSINRTYYSGLMLVLMLSYTFVRARFLWASLAGCTVTLAYLIGSIYSGKLPSNIVVNNNYFCMAANFMGMLVSYSLEFYARKDYYMSHLLEIEHQKAEFANQRLEQTVQKRTAMLAQANEELRLEIEVHEQLDHEKKQLEHQLRQAQKMEAIGTLAGGIAHDFNNILAAIMGHTELALMQMDQKENAQKYLSEVLNASDRAKELVAQILSFSRHGDQELKPIQIGSIIKEALRLIRSTLPTTIRIKKWIDNPTSIVVGNPTQIHQIMMNLCTNAAHAMKKSGGTLSVKLLSMDIPGKGEKRPPAVPANLAPGQYVQLIIADSGHGIAPHLLTRIFDPYFTTKEKDVGTGLGLAVVQGIVQNHGGHIEVESDIGKGTTFFIYLPRVESEITPELTALRSIPTGDENILFVDDDPTLAELGGKLLTTLGYRVITEVDPKKALQHCLDRPGFFDIVITDLIMPGLTGDVLATEILKHQPDKPIIACTGFSERLDEKEILASGIRGVLHKPMTIYKMANVIRNVLDETGTGKAPNGNDPGPKDPALD